MIEEGVFDAMRALCGWARGHPFVKRLWIFGSRLKGVQRLDSDLDVALEIDPIGRDEIALTSWIRHSSEWKDELAPLTRYPIDLQFYDPTDRKCRIVDYVACCAALIYERDS